MKNQLAMNLKELEELIKKYGKDVTIADIIKKEQKAN